MPKNKGKEGRRKEHNEAASKTLAASRSHLSTDTKDSTRERERENSLFFSFQTNEEAGRANERERERVKERDDDDDDDDDDDRKYLLLCSSLLSFSSHFSRQKSHHERKRKWKLFF